MSDDRPDYKGRGRGARNAEAPVDPALDRRIANAMEIAATGRPPTVAELDALELRHWNKARQKGYPMRPEPPRPTKVITFRGRQWLMHTDEPEVMLMLALLSIGHPDVETLLLQWGRGIVDVHGELVWPSRGDG